ncbi:hypothetical protein SAURM35S_05326 [Streptomyces aurantiogriseus]
MAGAVGLSLVLSSVTGVLSAVLSAVLTVQDPLGGLTRHFAPPRRGTGGCGGCSASRTTTKQRHR